MDIDVVKAVAVAVASVIYALFQWVKLYHGARADGFKLSSQRTKRFYKLVNDQSWHKTSPIALQMAFVDAYRYELDDRHIRFALSRHRPLALFRDLRRCAGMARLSDDGKHFVRWNGLKHPNWSYRLHSQIAFFSGFIPYVGFMLLSPYLLTEVQKIILGWSSVALLAWCLLTLFLANCFESAHRVVEAIDELYPAWGPETTKHSPAGRAAAKDPESALG